MSDAVELPIPLPFEPMEAEAVEALPDGEGWQYEPKWDGFRCLAFRDGSDVFLQSRTGKPLGRYFPDVERHLLALAPERFVLDGEIVIAVDGTFSFETLQLRLHPAASRVAKLAAEHPATLMAFDLLVDATPEALLTQPLAARREALEAFFEPIDKRDWVELSPATRSRAQAERWLDDIGDGRDGIVAKRLDEPYQPGRRAMQKYKLWHTVDCVVGGVYRKRGTDRVESILLGLYDGEGRLHYVGRSSVHADAEAMTARLDPLIGGPGFTGRAPGGKSRWSKGERQAIPLRPELVVEVSVDHITDQYFRHGSRILRWREDKKPSQCTMDQLQRRRAGG
jgi:ATP-dependent DNA ligase